MNAKNALQIQRQLEVVANRHGLVVRYQDGKFEVYSDPAAKAAQAAADKAEFARLAPFYGLNGEDWGKIFVVHGKVFTVIAIHPNRPKNALTIRDENGKDWHCSPGYYKTYATRGQVRDGISGQA